MQNDPRFAHPMTQPEEADALRNADALDKCPECGADLADENPEAHIEAHWGENIRQGTVGPGAQERIDALRREAQRRR